MRYHTRGSSRTKSGSPALGRRSTRLQASSVRLLGHRNWTIDQLWQFLEHCGLSRSSTSNTGKADLLRAGQYLVHLNGFTERHGIPQKIQAGRDLPAAMTPLLFRSVRDLLSAVPDQPRHGREPGANAEPSATPTDASSDDEDTIDEEDIGATENDVTEHQDTVEVIDGVLETLKEQHPPSEPPQYAYCGVCYSNDNPPAVFSFQHGRNRAMSDICEPCLMRYIKTRKEKVYHKLWKCPYFCGESLRPEDVLGYADQDTVSWYADPSIPSFPKPNIA